ncbi:MAG: ATPase, T2SS/T4P/T4SS family [Phycisphaerales bacterium]
MADIRRELAAAIHRLAAGEGVHLNGDWPGPESDSGTDVSCASLIGLAREAGVSDAAVTRATAEAVGVPYIDSLAGQPASVDFIEQVPIGFARRHQLIGLANGSTNGKGPITVAASSLRGIDQINTLNRFLGRPIHPVIAPLQQVQAAINAAYQQQQDQAQTFIAQINREDVLTEVSHLTDREDLLDVDSRAPVIKLVNLILFEAVKLRASDVHIQPYEETLVVRLRIDGVLYDSFNVPKHLQDEVLSRLKVMGKMNIAEKRLAQDGRAAVQVGDRIIDLRIASLPTSFGERIVIRLLDKSSELFTLTELGMPDKTLEQFRGLIGYEHGLILVTGPTGSGKSTTLYAALQQVNATERNILTLEDPIEYQLPGISQTQVSEKKGLTFAHGLRSVLRQDPDIIMVGEIRDHETAVMAIQSALTGHLVFSTLHTNDAPSAVTRLLDLGVEPYLVASSLVGVLAQRLVRRVCKHCGAPYVPSGGDLTKLGLDSERLDVSLLRKGAGCETCRQTGYAGREGIFELLPVNDAIRHKIQSHASASQISAVAVEHGMETLRDAGVAKVRQGITTIDEVVRVTTRVQS